MNVTIQHVFSAKQGEAIQHVFSAKQGGAIQHVFSAKQGEAARKNAHSLATIPPAPPTPTRRRY